MWSLLCISALICVSSFSVHNKILTLYKNNNKPQIFNDINEMFENNPSKLIISTPGGLFGFYFMGVSSFIKEHYDLSDYVFSGASAGAWNSLFLSLKENDKLFIDEILKTDVKNIKSILKLEKKMKSFILDNYDETMFDIDKLYLGVTVLDKSELKLCIYNDFISLEDAVDCCIASSHIPFVTGGPFNIYRNKFSFDGGFYSYPYLNVSTPSLIIERDLWDKKNKTEVTDARVAVINCSFDTLFNLNKVNFTLSELYQRGYNDSMKNKGYLDNIFTALK